MQNSHDPALLRWIEPPGVGFFPVQNERSPYDQAYFDKYVGYAATDRGREITRARVDMVRQHVGRPASLLDVGIGCGQFLDACWHEGWAASRGCDVNPAGLAWLRERKALDAPAWHTYEVVTFWDSIEHIFDLDGALARAETWVFVAMPVFTDLGHVRRSRHFRPDEHFWYFTDAAFRAFMAGAGFDVVDSTEREVELGREDIRSYACRRREDA